jgi:hypothetical protein
MFGPTGDEASGPEVTAVERALRELSPRPAVLDRDAILFRAGQSAAPRSRLWPLATALAVSVAVVLGVRLALLPGPRVVERIVRVPVVVAAPPDKPAGPAEEREPASPGPDSPAPSYQTPQHRLQERLLLWGLDGLGEIRPDPEPPRFRSPLAVPLSPSGDFLP